MGLYENNFKKDVALYFGVLKIFENICPTLWN